MKILVTGSTGFVGRNLLIELVQDEKYQEIILPVRNPEKLKAQLREDGIEDALPRLKIVSAEAPTWDFPVMSAVDHLVHCAGTLFSRDKEKFLRTNVDGTLELFKKVAFKKAVILSSQAASGPCVDKPCKDEGDRNSPITWYGRSKLEMEKRLRLEFGDRNYICFRPPIVLGARDQATLPLFKMAKGPVHLKPGLKPKFYSFISVSDLVAAILTALACDIDFTQLPQREYFVASADPISDLALIGGAAEVLNRRRPLLRVPQTMLKGIVAVMEAVPAWRGAIPSLSGDRALEVWPDRWVVTSEAFQSQFGWKAKAPLIETLKQAHAWYVKTGQI